MVDTSVLIDYFRKTDKSKTRLVQLSQQFDQLAIASVTEFEVYSGATKAQMPLWDQLMAELVILPFDSNAARIAVEIHQDLKKIRKSVDTADLFKSGHSGSQRTCI